MTEQNRELFRLLNKQAEKRIHERVLRHIRQVRESK